MKYFRILILVLVLPMISAAPVHKFYVSITKIEFVKKKNSIQIITKIFTDDIEDALQYYDASISLNANKNNDKTNAALKKYLLQKLSVSVNGEPIQLNYLGMEYENDMVITYIEAENIKDIENISIENKILMEIFSEQQNIIHLKTSKSRRSLILDKDEPSGELNF